MKCYLDLSRGLREDPKNPKSPRLTWTVEYANISDVHDFTNGSLVGDARDYTKATQTPRYDFNGDMQDTTYKTHVRVADHYETVFLSEADGKGLAFQKTMAGLPVKGIDTRHNLGNHERALFHLIGRTSHDGLFRIDRESQFVTSKGKRILAMHGDIFDVPVRFHQTREYLGTHAYELLTKLCLWGNGFAQNPHVRDFVELTGIKPPQTLSMFLKGKVDAWVFNRAYVESAFEEVFRRNAAILTEHKRAGLTGKPPYIDILVTGHTHIPLIEKKSSPLDSEGNPIGPETVKLYVTGPWVGPAKAKPEDEDLWWDAATVKPRTSFVVIQGEPEMVIYRPNKGIFAYTPPSMGEHTIVWPDQVKIQPVNG